MLKKNLSSGQNVDELTQSGKRALEQGLISEAIGYLQSALDAGQHSYESEAIARCYLSEALEKASLYKEQLEASRRFENPKEIVRCSDRTQVLLLIRLGWAHSFNND